MARKTPKPQFTYQMKEYVTLHINSKHYYYDTSFELSLF